MRIFISIILMLAGLSSYAQYSYKGKPITEDKFNELYSCESKFLFAYKDTVVDLMDKEGNICKFDDKSGMATASMIEARKETQEALVTIDKVTKTVTESAIQDPLSKLGISKPAKATDTKTVTTPKPYVLINLLPEDFRDKINVPILVLDKVKAGYDKKMAPDETLAVRLLPVTKEQFAKYIADGKSLYRIVKSDAVYDKCSKCQGSAKMKNPNYKQGKADSKQYLPCEGCKGSGKIIKMPAKNEKKEIAP